MGTKKRERSEIIRDILYNINEFKNIYAIKLMCKANLNQDMFVYYIKFLEEGDFIKIEVVLKKGYKRPHKQFSLNEKGRNYIKEYDGIVKVFLEKYGL